MDKVLVFGHKNPDTDSICSAIAYADLKRQLGMPVEAVRLGELNEETKYVLNAFQVGVPRQVETVANEVRQVILVDHNESQQSVSDRSQVQVIEVIDHHRIASFETAAPLYYRAEPVGCTATILNKLFKEHHVTVGQDIAGLMLSAIVSDTLLMKSPTCTNEDVNAIRELAAIAGVDVEDYGLRMLKAGADLSGRTVQQLISMDAKEFPMGSHRVEIAQVNAVDVNDVLSRKTEVVAQLESVVAEKGLALFLFAVTDILNSNSVALAVGPMAHMVEQAFGVRLEDGQTTLNGVVSRKKQIVPVLTDAFTKD